ncbi:hypothetical protein [Streptomyces griseus]|uniref:hypothetical protein n=1 Tax=Streptomyces griseus TaxID=1911 RepID=UPI0008401D22|nr:hypothetical protein [Streptomyces griseus]
MAVEQLSATPCPPHVSASTAAHPMAGPGYGKRSAPGQRPRTATDFAHLAPREAAIASYIDRLPDGSDISVKTLARTLPYGQCALRTALNRLQAAGHLRRGSECVTTDRVMLWVTRTFFSRTARDDAWWETFERGDVPVERRERPTRSRAFALLAALGRTAPALSLSAAECAGLEPHVGEWFERGATEAEVVGALTTGLPTPVHHAASLLRRRLTDKMPPHRPAPVERPPLITLECGECRAPGSSEALRGGLCGPCRGEVDTPPTGPPGAVPTGGVRERMASVRAGLVPRPDRTSWSRGRG